MEEVIPRDILKVIPGQSQYFSLKDDMQFMTFSPRVIMCRPSVPYARALIADLERHFKIGYQIDDEARLHLYVEPVAQRLVDATEAELEALDKQRDGSYIQPPVTGIPFGGFAQGFSVQIWFRRGKAVFTAISEAVFRHIHLMFPDKREMKVVTKTLDGPPQDVFIPMHTTTRSLRIHRVLNPFMTAVWSLSNARACSRANQSKTSEFARTVMKGLSLRSQSRSRCW